MRYINNINLRRRGVSCAVLLVACLSVFAFGLSESTGPGGSNVKAVHERGFTGQGIHIGFISIDNILDSHEAFFEKDAEGLPNGPPHVFIHDILGEGTRISNHDTNLAGIIVSNGGQAQLEQIGSAPLSFLHNVRVSDSSYLFKFEYLRDALNELIINQGCKVIVTGFQLPIQGDGDNEFVLIYDYYAYQHDVIFSNAAGNDIDSEVVQISSFGDAYNGITTAGLVNTASQSVYDKTGTLSLPGPTDDGRNKPELGAPSPYQTVPSSSSNTSWTTVTGTSQGYTSWAVPHTAGAAAVLLDYADGTADPDDERSEVIKAALVNAAFPNIDDKAGSHTTGLTWHADRGYGRLNVLRAFELLQSPRVSPSVVITQERGWAHKNLSSQSQDIYQIEVHQNERLVVTLTWHRRIQWNDRMFPASGRDVIEITELTGFLADLEMMIKDPANHTVYTGPGGKNNLEKADILPANTGIYQVIIRNKSINENADYGLAFEILAPLPGDFNIDYIVNFDDLAEGSGYWLMDECTDPERDCFKIDLSGNGLIELSDFSQLAKNWLVYDNRYYSE